MVRAHLVAYGIYFCPFEGQKFFIYQGDGLYE